MENAEKITVKPCGWSEEVAVVLAASMSYATVDDLKLQVDEGASLFSVTYKGEPVGFYVLRVDHLMSGAEGVLVAAAGRCADVDLTQSLVPVIERQFVGCKTMRVHTARPGLIKKLAALGYAPREFVMGKNLD